MDKEVLLKQWKVKTITETEKTCKAEKGSYSGMRGKSRAALCARDDEVGVRAQSPGGKHFRQSTNLAAICNSDQRNRRKETGRKRRLLDSISTAAQPRREKEQQPREKEVTEKLDTGFPDTPRKSQGRVLKARVKQEHSFKLERLDW